MVAESRSSGPKGWLAFSEPAEAPAGIWSLLQPLSLLGHTILHWCLLALSSLAFCAWAVKAGIEDSVLLGLIALIAIAGIGYAAFIFWFISPYLGFFYSVLWPPAAVWMLVVLFRKFNTKQKELLRMLFLPSALVGITALVVILAGFLFGGLMNPSPSGSTVQRAPSKRQPLAFYVSGRVEERPHSKADGGGMAFQ